MAAIDDAKRLIRHFCCDERTARYGPYETVLPDGDPEVREVLPGQLYTCQLLEGDALTARIVDVSVHLGLSDLGGLMWDQEVRALSRLSGLAHPALPELLGGGYQERDAVEVAGARVDGAAFVATEGSDYTLAVSGTAVYRQDRVEALRQFEHLADGLAVLHDLGLAHRNLSPHNVDVVDAHLGTPRLRLARFEMSAFISSLLGGGPTLDSQTAPGTLRRLFLGGGPGALAYMPPERWRFLLPLDERTATAQENPTADVYSLAVMAWEWFVGPLPADLVPSRLPETQEEYRAAHDLLERLGDHLRASLRTADIPAELGGLLRRMLDPGHEDRPTSTEVVNELSDTHDSNVVGLGGVTGHLPYLLAFMPDKSDETLGRWEWLTFDADTDEGIRETAELLRADLKKATVLHSVEGADPFVGGGSTEAKRLATVVLVGERALWFGQFLRPPNTGHGLGEPMPEVLVIKYVAQRDAHAVNDRLKSLENVSRSRSVPEVQPIDYRMPLIRLNALRRDRPSWQTLVDTIRPVGSKSEAQLDYQRAIDWLLEYQGVELQARRYPFRADPAAEHGRGEEILVHWDRDRDRDRIYRRALLAKYAGHADLRPSFGDFFGRLENEESGSAEVEVYGSDRDRKPGSVQGVLAYVVRREGQDRVVLRRKPGQPRLPSRGWMRPADDVGTEAVLSRQVDARFELFALAPLTSRLRNPTAIKTLPHRWKDAGEGLLEGGREVVRDILTHQPFFALQGPPGTGKTTVTSRAVAAYLKQEPTHRILVSAQSNFTLDNLAARILKDIGARDDDGPTDRLSDVPIALRMVSRRNTPDEAVRPWLRDELVVRRSRQMRQRVQDLLDSGIDGAVRPVLQSWHDLLAQRDGHSILPELGDRLQRGANIVFATCATATPRNIGTPGGASAFDWVIVEEAAKAWPTELAIPLVRGTRWTLIGDHFQLPAHRRDEVVRFLDSCVGDPNTGIAVAGEQRQKYVEAFDLFRNLFVKRPGGPRERPVAMLSTQFRMREPIAQVVSRVFYPRALEPGETAPADGLKPGGLATHHEEEPSPLRAPHWLRERSLVWVDTARLSGCVEEPHWRNEGEAAVVRAVVRSLDPEPVPGRHGYSAEPLAVLTPYRLQAEELRRDVGLAKYVQTVHAFQGREADIVVVSLVRNRVRGNGSAAESYGHLARRDLINVLFSRARRLLVVVGDYGHFSRYHDDNDPFWPEVCQAVDHYGHVYDAATVLPEVAS